MTQQYCIVCRISLKIAFVLTLFLAPSLALGTSAQAQGFGGVGVGAQVLVVDSEQGTESGAGLDLRTRFLWILGLEFSATDLDGAGAVWGVAPYRVSLLIHAIQTEYFQLYLAPGLSGGGLGDAFNPVGDTTWYRLGGGVEFSLFDGLRIGGDIHWTVPGERQTEAYLNTHGEVLLNEFLAGLSPNQAIPTSFSELQSQLSTSQLLDLLPLDRLEFAVGVRYYF